MHSRREVSRLKVLASTQLGKAEGAAKETSIIGSLQSIASPPRRSGFQACGSNPVDPNLCIHPLLCFCSRSCQRGDHISHSSGRTWWPWSCRTPPARGSPPCVDAWQLLSAPFRVASWAEPLQNLASSPDSSFLTSPLIFFVGPRWLYGSEWPSMASATIAYSTSSLSTSANGGTRNPSSSLVSTILVSNRESPPRLSSGACRGYSIG